MPACSCESVFAAALCSDSFIFTVAKMKGSSEPSKSTLERQTELAKSTLQRQIEPAKSNLQRQRYICSVKNEYCFEPAKIIFAATYWTGKVNFAVTNWTGKSTVQLQNCLQFVAFQRQLSAAVKEILRHNQVAFTKANNSKYPTGTTSSSSANVLSSSRGNPRCGWRDAKIPKLTNHLHYRLSNWKP